MWVANTWSEPFPLLRCLTLKKRQENRKLSLHYSWTGKKNEYFYSHTFLNKSCHLILLSETCKSKEVEVCCSTETGICEGLCRTVKNKELTSREVANNIYNFSFSRLWTATCQAPTMTWSCLKRGKWYLLFLFFNLKCFLWGKVCTEMSPASESYLIWHPSVGVGGENDCGVWVCFTKLLYIYTHAVFFAAVVNRSSKQKWICFASNFGLDTVGAHITWEADRFPMWLQVVF